MSCRNCEDGGHSDWCTERCRAERIEDHRKTVAAAKLREMAAARGERALALLRELYRLRAMTSFPGADGRDREAFELAWRQARELIAEETPGRVPGEVSW